MTLQRRFWLGLVCLALMAAACAPAATPAAPPDPQPSPESEPGAGDLEGDLVVYTARSEALFKPVLAAFNAAHPEIKVTVLYGANGELAAKLLEEQANPVADVFVSTELLLTEDLASKGLYQPSSAAGLTEVPAGYRADDSSWVALTLRARVIMYNTNLVKPEELPDSISDLVDPKWKGQVGATDSTSGAMMAHLAALRHLGGDAQVTDFVSGLVANEARFFGGHTDVRKAVGAGELKLGFVNQYYYFLSLAEGAPVGIVWPDQGADQPGLIVNATTAGVLKGARHREAADAFIAFMLSAEGQKLYAERNYEYPVIAGVPLAEGVPPLSQFKLAALDFKTIWAELAPTRALAQAAGLP